MDDSFAFRTTAPVRRQIDRRLVKAGIGAGVILCVMGWFASWVIASERRSLSDRPAAVVPAIEPPGGSVADPAATATEAEEALRLSFVAARAASIDDRTYVDAGPGRLTELQPGYTFVDGPSTMPRIVSVATSHEAWAAAVMASDGTCLWIRATLDGDVTRTTGADCTGSAALGSRGRG